MANNIPPKEEIRLQEVLNCIDKILNKCDIWLNQRTDTSRMDRELLQSERRIVEDEAQNMQIARPSPYFGRIDFIDESIPSDVKTLYFGEYYIPGNNTVIQQENNQRYVISNDAPIARLFYQPMSGEFEVIIKRALDTTIKRYKRKVTLKRIIIIENGIIKDYNDEYRSFGSEDTSKPNANAEPESYLTSELGKPKETKLKKIVVTIQPEQYEAIASSSNRVVLIQGAAGSGKSVIGLHRIAYLLSPHNELDLQISPSNVAFFGPSKIFLNYISTVLPSLRVERVKRLTIREWLNNIKPSTLKLPKKDILLTKLLSGGKADIENEISIAKTKSSLKMAKLLEKHVYNLKKSIISNCKDMVSTQDMSVIIKAIKIKNIFHRVLQDRTTPVNELREKALSQLINELPRGRDLKPGSILRSLPEIEFQKMWPKFDPTQTYRELLGNRDYLNKATDGVLIGADRVRLVEQSVGLKSFTIEDIAPICYLNNLLNGFNTSTGKKRKVNLFEHIVLDESQDISPLELKLLYIYSSNKIFTILGDVNQYLLPHHGVNTWDEILKIFAKENPRKLVIRSSYRSTFEITSCANIILKTIGAVGRSPIPYTRHGEYPILTQSKSYKLMVGAIEKDIKSLLNPEQKTIAVICKTPRDAIKMQKCLATLGISNNNSNEQNQSDVTTLIVSSVYETKGLEYDVVILADAGKNKYSNSNFDERLLYIAVTRAAHKLHIHCYGKLAEVLRPVFESEKKRRANRAKKTGIIHKRKSSGSVPTKAAAFDLLTYLTDKGLNFVDNRPQGGALWLIGGEELNPVIEELKAKGFHFSYTHKGGHASNYEPAWYSPTKV